MDKRKWASIVSIVVGVVMVLAGITTWVIVSNTLSDQKITTSEDACLPNKQVKGPFTAYCQAKVIDKHTKKITGGKTYAELAQDDPNRSTAMTSSFLQASLFTSVVAFGVAFMAAVIGIVFVLIGLALRDGSATSGAAPPTEPAAA